MYNVEKITSCKVELDASHSAQLEKTILEMGLKHREEFGCETGYETYEWFKISLVGVKQIGKLLVEKSEGFAHYKKLYIQNSSKIQFCVEELHGMGCESLVNILPQSHFFN